MDVLLREKHRQFQRGEIPLAEFFTTLDRYGQLGAFLAEGSNLQDYHIQCVRDGLLKFLRFSEKPAVETIKWLTSQQLAKTGLIVCRAVARERWRTTLTENNIDHEILLSSQRYQKVRKLLEPRKITVLSYETFNFVWEDLLKEDICKESLFVCDNIEKLKNPGTLISENILFFFEKTKPQWKVLIGEINLQNLERVYNVSKILSPDKFSSYARFRMQYFYRQSLGRGIFLYKEVPGARNHIFELLTSTSQRPAMGRPGATV